MLRTLIAGDTLKFTATLADYPASAGWVLHYRLTPRSVTGTPAAYTFDASADGDSHLVDVSASTTAAWNPGSYTAAAWVTLGTERYTITGEGGQVTVQANPAALPLGTDTRSETELALIAVRAKLKGQATAGVESYRINNRELRYYTLTELIKLESKLAADLAREQAAAGQAPTEGGNTARRLYLRMPS